MRKLNPSLALNGNKIPRRRNHSEKWFLWKGAQRKKKNISENYQKQKQTEWYLWVKILELWHAIKVICLIVSNQREAWKYQKERNREWSSWYEEEQNTVSSSEKYKH